MSHLPLFSNAFLSAHWEEEFERFRTSDEAVALLARLRAWSERDVLKESSSEAAFIQRFFIETWGYTAQGHGAHALFHCYPQYPVARAGQGGGTGSADLALGNFGGVLPNVPQVLCEFKDIHSGLDQKQNRKGSYRSPVKQCLDYLNESRNSLTGNELVSPTWGIVTDMSEFRLYFRGKGSSQCQRFIIGTSSSNGAVPLLVDGEEGEFRRFLFFRVFHRDTLLAERGPSYLERLFKDQILNEKVLEKDFYLEYKAYRENLYKVIVAENPNFSGTKGKLVRLTQRFLDRCIFILFCEDMGSALLYPPNLLRDMLIEYSKSITYNENSPIMWNNVKELFRNMQFGGDFGVHRIQRFNGGLFEDDPELDSLRIPAKVFCARNQGAGGAETLYSDKNTLLYFSSRYNFGIKESPGERVVDLYALGRIFEQSITELEIMEAEAEGRPSINKLSKRKRDGVYYTPEWVTGYIVEETVGARLNDIRESLGLTSDKEPTEEDVRQYRRFLKDKRLKSPVGGNWVRGLREYRRRLDHLRVVDPACGSGAFLIQALERLRRERKWIADEMGRVGEPELFDADQVTREILTHNLFGVDINPESVEITKLALWMHTAVPGKPLSGLDRTIRCGNSLVGPDFYAVRQGELFSADERDRINAFDWRAAFSEAFDHGGFDCVVGNPPYVKLQHFRRAESAVAEYLLNAKRRDGSPLYESTQTGNFDLYLPFIERGMELLRPEGRMGYIAPNLWAVNEYGQGLRKKVRRTGQLDRWVDFKSFQVFDEAITYTALQFFTGRPAGQIRCAFAFDGNVDRIEWDKIRDEIPYAELTEEGAWNLLPNNERALVSRLSEACSTLEASCKGITVGIQTSADSIYHLKKLGQGRYETADGAVENIEDSLMRPLVSGPEAKRYQKPKTDTYLLFPYDLTAPRPLLFPEAAMTQRFPLGWAYLKKHEDALRARENSVMDSDDKWWAYNYPKNLDKQEVPKLMVPRLVIRLFCTLDNAGEYFLDNVDVGGVLAENNEDLPYLMAILNAPVANFVWRRISKPFQNDYRSANKQFIAPLPIPNAAGDQKREVSALAERLQELHTRRRDLAEMADRRLSGGQTEANVRKETWLWGDIRTAAEWKRSPEAPEGLSRSELAAWAKRQVEERLSAHLEEIDARLRAGAELRVENTADELRLRIDGAVALEVFDDPQTPFIAAQWRQTLGGMNVTESFSAKTLLGKLLRLRATGDENLRRRVVELDTEIGRLDVEIAEAEAKINALIYALYGLSQEEIRMVEAG